MNGGVIVAGVVHAYAGEKLEQCRLPSPFYVNRSVSVQRNVRTFICNRRQQSDPLRIYMILLEVPATASRQFSMVY